MSNNRIYPEHLYKKAIADYEKLMTRYCPCCYLEFYAFNNSNASDKEHRCPSCREFFDKALTKEEVRNIKINKIIS